MVAVAMTAVQLGMVAGSLSSIADNAVAAEAMIVAMPAVVVFQEPFIIIFSVLLSFAFRLLFCLPRTPLPRRAN